VKSVVCILFRDFSRRQKSSQKNNSVLDILFKRFVFTKKVKGKEEMSMRKYKRISYAAWNILWGEMKILKTRCCVQIVSMRQQIKHLFQSLSLTLISMDWIWFVPLAIF